eukprot:s1037_g3.t5
MNPVALFMPAPKPHAYEPPAHHALLFSMVVMEFWISDRAFAMLVSRTAPTMSQAGPGFKTGPIPYRKKLLQSRAKPCPSPHLLQHAASEGFKDFSSSEAVRRLHHAASCGSVASVQALLETLSSEDWCHACDSAGTSVLHAAVTGGHLHIANALGAQR